MTPTRPDLDGLAEFLHRDVFPAASAVHIEDLSRPTGGASWETYISTVRLTLAGRVECRRVVLKRHRRPARSPRTMSART